MSLMDFLFGRNRVSGSDINNKIAGKVKGQINNTIVHNPLNDWRLAAVRQYILYPAIKAIFGPILVSAKGRHFYQRIDVAIDTFISNKTAPLRRTREYALEQFKTTKNPLPIVRYILAKIFGDTLFKEYARKATGQKGIKRMQRVALSSLILERRRMIALSWIARGFWLASMVSLYEVFLAVESDGPGRVWRTLVAAASHHNIDLFLHSATGAAIQTSAGLWLLSMLLSVWFSALPIFSGTRKIEKFLMDATKASEDEIFRMGILANDYCVSVLTPSERLTMQRISSIKGRWPNGYSPGPSVVSTRIEGAFSIARRPEPEKLEFVSIDLSSPQERKLFNQKVVAKMQEARATTKEELVYLGEVLAPEVWEFKKNYIELKNNPHLVAIGKTRSGKTKSLLSVVYTFAAAYPDTVWYFADGKNGQDFEPAAAALSELPVARIRSAADGGLVEFANQLLEVHSEFKRRQGLFEGTGASSIYEYNRTSGKTGLPQVVFIIDEFFSFVNEMGFKANEKSVDTLAGIFRTLMAQGAGFGIHFFVGTQRYQETDVPTTVRTNMTAKLTHAVEFRDAEFNEVPKGANLEAGMFFLTAAGHFTEYSNMSSLKSMMPYIGNDSSNAMREVAKRGITKRSWNLDIEFNLTDSDDDFATPKKVATMFVSLFRDLKRTNYLKIGVDTDISPIQFVVSEGAYTIGVTSIQKDHLTEEFLFKVAQAAAKYNCDSVIMYILGIKPVELRSCKQAAMVKEYNNLADIKFFIQTVFDLRKDRKNANADPNEDVFTHRLVSEKIIQKDEALHSGIQIHQTSDRDFTKETLDKYLNALLLYSSAKSLPVLKDSGFVIVSRILPFGIAAYFIVLPNKKQGPKALAIAQTILSSTGGSKTGTAVFIVGPQVKVAKADGPIASLSQETISEAHRKIAVSPTPEAMTNAVSIERYDLLRMVGYGRTGGKTNLMTGHLVGDAAEITLSGTLSNSDETIIGLSLLCDDTGERIEMQRPIKFSEYSLASLGIPETVKIILDHGIVAPIGADPKNVMETGEEAIVLDESSPYKVEGRILYPKSPISVDADDQRLLDLMRRELPSPKKPE